MTRVYGNGVTNTSGGHTRTWRLYADYTGSSTETNYTVKGTSIGVQNTASASSETMSFNANSLTASYSGVLTASYRRTTKTGNIKGGATFEIYGTDISTVIERTRVEQIESLTFEVVASSNTAWEGTSTEIISLTIPARSSHVVSYDANGGSGSIASFTKFYSEVGETAYYETLSDGSGFSKAGYYITEWNTMPDGSGTSYPLLGEYTANGTTAVTLYAQWKTAYVKPEIQNLLAFRVADASGGASPAITSTGETGFCRFELIGGADYTVTSATVQFGTATANSMTKSGTIVYGYSTVGSIAQASAYTVKVTVVITGGDGISRTYTDSTYISKSVPVFDVSSNGNCFAFFGTATDDLTDPKLIINGELELDTALSIANGGTGATTAEQARINLGIEVDDTGWIDATLTSSFTLYSADDVCQYRKIGKHVQLRGVVKPTAALAGSLTGVVIFTLPEEFTPSQLCSFVCQGSSVNKWLLQVSTNGNVSFSRYGTSSLAQAGVKAWLTFDVGYLID